jgi:hypothetical protein
MQRTPPATSHPTLSISRSESDLPNVTLNTMASITNVTTRNKRQRTETSPDNSPILPSASSSDGAVVPGGDLRSDVIGLLSSWKDEQDRRLSEWKTDLDNTLSKLVTQVSDLQKECLLIRRANVEIERSIDFMNKKHEETIAKISIMEREKNANTEAIKVLENQIQDFNFQTRQATIEIRNVPLIENESYESLVKVVSTLGEKMDLCLGSGSIRDVYRLPGKLGVIRPIVAEFSSVHTRNELITRIRRFNRDKEINDKLNTETIGLPGMKKPIYVDEHIVPPRRKLLFDTRQFARKHNFSAWHSNGRIFIRTEQTGKPFQIKTEKCLEEFMKKI